MKNENGSAERRGTMSKKIKEAYRPIMDGYSANPDQYVLTWASTVNRKKRTFVSYKCSTEGAALRHLHHAIDVFLRNSYVPSDGSFAYMEGSSILSCLNKHLHNDVFLKTDIHSFFTTIEKDRLVKVLEKNVKRPYKKLCDSIVESCYYNGEMPLGFITSPVLSDLFLTELDTCFDKRKDIIYTRYADDFIISTSGEDAELVLQDVLNEIKDRLQKLGLELNAKKTYIRRLRQSGDAIHLLGLNVVKTVTDTNRITVSDSYIRKTSIEFCNLLYNKNNMAKEELKLAFSAVYGRIQFIKNASERSAMKLQKMLSVKLNREIVLNHQALSRLFSGFADN